MSRSLPTALTLLAATGCAVETDPYSTAASETRNNGKEQFLYITAINAGGSTDPDMLAVVGIDPEDSNYGKIIRRVDMPNVGDEVHHFGYSADMDRLIIPGLFSGRIHVFDVSGNAKKPVLTSINNNVIANSGYIVPHSIIAQQDGTVLATMIGSLSDTTLPGGIVRLNDKTGQFVGHFGPGPGRTAQDLGPKYMYDYHYNHDLGVGVSTSFGPPALCAGGIDPSCLGNEVAVWDHEAERVTQVVDLGMNSGALESRWVETPGSTFGYTNAPGTSTVWMWEDEDRNGTYSFHQVLGPEDGLLIPADMLLSADFRFMFVTNWFGNTVQMFDITDRYHPTLIATVEIPHPNMLRLSRDGRRLYVTNSLLSTWDNDTDFGPARNTDYGLWILDLTATSMTSRTGSAPLVDFDTVQKATSVGPAGPHMMLFDPSIVLLDGEH